MTETPYLGSPDVREFEATVERVAGDRVVLDRTFFYPEGGGQPNDTGTLAVASDDGEGDGDDEDDHEWQVVDVQKKDTIYHTLEPVDDSTVDSNPPAEGTRVVGHLDWDRRHAHMRYHTAQHLLSAILLEEYDANTTGNQLYADRARIDCGYDRFTDEEFDAIEARMNEYVAAGLPVRWYEMDRETAEAELDPERTRIHLLPDSITEIRIVEIASPDGDGILDRTACAGTHVESTDEIGTFEITGRETKGSDEERLKFRLT
ncbi:alanyl-tRNA editing protein [Halorussus halophilus]|uniref:alanyl-tRNA editing protein n=1 Tax=Halorussus halophilus TaxID=2650975 RepID=UPI0013014295|nr:alanyl-tRNA editing protein [Halorussus halophilus]